MTFINQIILLFRNNFDSYYKTLIMSMQTKLAQLDKQEQFSLLITLREMFSTYEYISLTNTVGFGDIYF